jgi:hypothetical protein
MDRAVAQGGLIKALDTGDFVVAVARPDEDADIRGLLRQNATDGWIRLSLEREPDAFAAARILGQGHSYIVARSRRDDEVIGIAEWWTREAYVDGEPRALAHLGGLRIVPRYRHRLRVLKHGFELARQLQRGSGTSSYALTSVAADNHVALRLLGANLPGMPTYRPIDFVSTFALRTANARPEMQVDHARAEDMAAIAVRLERSHRPLQFAPIWRARDLLSPERVPGLQPRDFLIVRRGVGIAGVVALWDQGAFKQTVVRGYRGALSGLRRAVNAFAPLAGLPHLPRPGEPLRQVYLSHLAIEGDDPALFCSLLAAALAEARRRNFGLALLGLASRHPLATVVADKFRHREYRALLHLVHWDDGRSAVEALEPRIPHVEIAVL